MFRPASRSLRDSHVMVQDSELRGNAQPAQILALFILSGEENATFAIISRYIPLSDVDANQDPYRQFGMVAGRLYYDATEAPTVTHASNFLTLFAKTAMKLSYIEKLVIHVLPLYKVSFIPCLMRHTLTV